MLKKYKWLLKREMWTGKEMAEKLGLTYDSYRTLTKKSAEVVPKWVTAFVIAYELGQKDMKRRMNNGVKKRKKKKSTPKNT
jgi:DNA-binding XRE family transcriptional regulator